MNRRHNTNKVRRERRAADPRLRQVRERLRYIADQAVQAQRLGPQDDTLLDLIDTMDNDLQAVIELVNCIRNDGEVA
jgi:hypothetical protein